MELKTAAALLSSSAVSWVGFLPTMLDWNVFHKLNKLRCRMVEEPVGSDPWGISLSFSI